VDEFTFFFRFGETRDRGIEGGNLVNQRAETLIMETGGRMILMRRDI
jgi:hypothetical protein